MKKFLLIATLLTVISTLLAHEFWLSPDKFIYQKGEKINIRFFVGENFEGENWKGNNEKVQSLKLYFGGVSDDLSAYISEEKGDSLEMTMLDEGTNLVAFNSTNSYLELEASKFNEYLKEDGLTDAIEYRKQNNETDSASKEYYQRCSKTLIQVGKVKDKTFSVATDLPVDIIPLSNPYSLRNNDTLAVKILFRNTPLRNTLIKIWQRNIDKTIKTDLTSDGNGEIKFPVSATGKWMISVVKMVRLENDPKAHPISIGWQSYWGSLTWGYE
jgi:uncharacterized GH25 family protein